MIRVLVSLGVMLSVGGCAAYVPNLETEATFSYAEVASQIECETYLAISKIEIERHFHNRHGIPGNPIDMKEEHLDYLFKNWIMSIQVLPNLSYDGSVGIGSTSKSSATAKNYFQWALGGGTSPGGVTYESYGAAFANNTYIFPITKLFDLKSAPLQYNNSIHHYAMSDINPALKRICSPAPNRPVSNIIKALVESEDLSLPNTIDKRFKLDDSDNLHQDAVPNVVDIHGLFGIYDFLDRSLAANSTLDILPSTIGFSKQYKVKVSAGVTPGWYVATGNTSLNAGVVRTVDNTITVVFTPRDNAKISKLELMPPAKGTALTRFVNYNSNRLTGINGVSSGELERIQNANTSLQLQNLPNQLGQSLR